MSKDAYWFKHDANARVDVKMVKLRRKKGLEGVGLFWCVVEMLREADGYKLNNDSIEDIVYELRTTEETFEELFSCGLLVKGESTFHSESLNSRLENHEELKEKRRIAGSKGGKAKAKNKQKLASAKDNVASAKQNSSDALANSSDKIREDKSIEDKSIEEDNNPPKSPKGELEYSEEFEKLWEFYQRHGNKKSANTQFKKLKAEQKEEMYKVVRAYVDNTSKQYRKACEVFLNAKSEVWKNDSRVMSPLDYVDDSKRVSSSQDKGCDVSKPTGVFARC